MSESPRATSSSTEPMLMPATSCEMRMSMCFPSVRVRRWPASSWVRQAYSVSKEALMEAAQS
ncbi:hypothetical protein ACFFX0_15785 [Citricoccus parietis]|uniref:Uncharacterized protein n=1 Tax=Citricoccus parietis TaxID=592307 RepID=A0ABV5G0X1_9MICC